MGLPARQNASAAAVVPQLRMETFRRFQELLRDRVGVFLTAAKAQLLISRLASRLRARDCASLEAYLELVTSAPGHRDEFQAMVNRITTNKTDFFRESHHFPMLAAHVESLTRDDPEYPVRVWSAACSTGEEPYTIAMVLRESLTPDAAAHASILASDIDTQVLERAGHGVYPQRRFAGIDPQRWQRWFLRGRGKHAGAVKVRPDLRRLVRFAQLNLVGEDWPEREAFDAVFCRNTLIYFDRPTQLAVVQRLAERLRPGGLLFLGHSENLLGDVPGLEPAGSTVFRRSRSRGGSAAEAPGIPLRALGARVLSGGMFCSARPAVVRTLLGSCVAACLFDPSTQIGGMNHFMLPKGRERGTGRALAYGAHAMEMLINEIMRHGGDRRRLQAKVFGAATVLTDFQGGAAVAQRNAEFVRRYLRDERIPIVGEKLGGTHPIQVRFETHTGRAFARDAGRARSSEAAAQDAAYFKKVSREARSGTSGEAELFEGSHD